MSERKSRFMRGIFLPVLLGIAILALCLAGVGAEERTPKYDRVIIFGVDGVGALIPETETPNFDRIFADGRVTYDAFSNVTVSAPAWGAMFYGVPGEVHGISNDDASRMHKKNLLYPSIFKLVREADPDARVASFSNWSAINWGLIEQDIGADLFPAVNKAPKSNEQMISKLYKYLDEVSPRLLFIYFGETDTALHSYGYGTIYQKEVITEVDRQIGEIYDELDRRGLLENSLVIFVTDHGGSVVLHGGMTDEETHCTFAVTGPGLEKEGTIGAMELQDVAAIVLYALGIEQPECQTAKVPTGIFAGAGEETRKESKFRELIERYAGYESLSLPEEPLPEELRKKRVYYQTFDGERVRGLEKKKELGPGLFGKAMEMSSTYLTTGSRHTAKWDGMTVAFWLRDRSNPETVEKDSDPVLVADKNWRYPKYKGFVIALRNRDDLYERYTDKIQIHVADEKGRRQDILWNLPEGYRNKRIHCMAVFDPETRYVSLYVNFALAGSAQMLPEKHKDWSTGRSIIAGQSVTGKYTYNMEGEMDELMIFSSALTEEEIATIRDWYDSAMGLGDY